MYLSIINIGKAIRFIVFISLSSLGTFNHPTSILTDNLLSRVASYFLRKCYLRTDARTLIRFFRLDGPKLTYLSRFSAGRLKNSFLYLNKLRFCKIFNYLKLCLKPWNSIVVWRNVISVTIRFHHSKLRHNIHASSCSPYKFILTHFSISKKV